MKSTEYFKRVIQKHLDDRAQYDEQFAVSYANPNKNIDDCITYILNYAKKSGCVGFADDEIFGQAVHYYDETDIEVGKPINCKVVVNQHIELTEEEKAEARQNALKRAADEAYAKLKLQQQRNALKRVPTTDNQPTLFDF